MNQDFIEGQTDLELVEVDSVVDSLSTWIELGAEGIVTFFSSDGTIKCAQSCKGNS